MSLVDSSHERASSDLSTFQQTSIRVCKSLKRKSGWTSATQTQDTGKDAEDGKPQQVPAKAVKVENGQDVASVKAEHRQAVRIKEEPKQSEEAPQQLVAPDTTPPESLGQDALLGLEDALGKHDLCKLHGLTILPKNTNGKKFGVRCPHCTKTFEGPNRAKIKQHTDGDEHRARWKKSRQEPAQQEQEPQPLEDGLADETNRLIKGECQGLRLGSVFGKQTRLGSDLLPVWQTYATFANFSRTLSSIDPVMVRSHDVQCSRCLLCFLKVENY